jgi:hypothetical protein
MTTPLDKCGYMFTESYGPTTHYRLVLGFENLDDLHAAQDYVVSLRQKSPAQETCEGCEKGWDFDSEVGAHQDPISAATCKCTASNRRA